MAVCLLLLFLGSIQLDAAPTNTWKNYKAGLVARGQQFDWQAFVPPPIPDHQNILKAPMMKQWMDRDPRVKDPILTMPTIEKTQGDWQSGKPTDLVEWRTLFASTSSSPSTAQGNTVRFRSEKILPHLSVNNASVLETILYLAREADTHVIVPPEVLRGESPVFSFRWENVTAGKTLLGFLDTYDLTLVPHNKEKDVLIVTNAPERAAIDSITLRHGLNTNLLPVRTNAEAIQPLPFFTFGNAPLLDAIANLARTADINIVFSDTEMVSSISEIMVNQTWENVTAVDALHGLLRQHGLILHYDPARGVGRIMRRPVPTAAEILDAFKTFEVTFRELREACRRPEARFDLDYSQGWERPYANFVFVRQLTRAAVLHASACLAVNDSSKALADVQTMLGLARIGQSEPTLVGAMISVAVINVAIQPVWEGMAAGRWNEEQLRTLQHEFSQIDLLSPVVRALRADLAQMTHIFELYSREQLITNVVYTPLDPANMSEQLQLAAITFAPRRSLEKAHISFCQGIEAYVDAIDLDRRVVSPRKALVAEAERNPELPFVKPFKPNWDLHFVNGLKILSFGQNNIHELMVACALERYRLHEGKYPEQVQVLQPRFIDKFPPDIINGEPLQYRREAKANFRLYSIGWDEINDEGKGAPRYWESGDWVWKYPDARSN